jgi:hypothetical protein
MYTLFKLSDKVGLVPTIIGIFAWLAFGMWATLAVVNRLWRFPMLAWVLTISFMVVTGIGGLVGFWLVADRFYFWCFGYQVKPIHVNDWIYEERSSASEIRTLSYIRELRGEGYPAICTIKILDAENWERDAPLWARGRRSEIVERIANCHGAILGVEVLIESGTLREAEKSS